MAKKKISGKKSAPKGGLKRPAKSGKASRSSAASTPSKRASRSSIVRPPEKPKGGKPFLVTCSECYEDWEIFPEGAPGMIVCPFCGHAAAAPTGDTLTQMTLFRNSTGRDLAVSTVAGLLVVAGFLGFVWFGSGTGDRAVTRLSSGVKRNSIRLPVGSTDGFPEEGALIRIGDELAEYGGVSADALDGLDRGVGNTATADHPRGTFVYTVMEVGNRPTYSYGCLGLALLAFCVFLFKGMGYEKNRWATYF